MRNAIVVLTSVRPSVISTRWLCASGSARSTVSQFPSRARSARRCARTFRCSSRVRSRYGMTTPPRSWELPQASGAGSSRSLAAR